MNDVCLNQLNKAINNVDYVKEEVKSCDFVQSNPTEHKYNYLNPLYFYSFNNFPVYYPVTINQSMPFLNYVSINNNQEPRRRSKNRFAEHRHSGQFDSNVKSNLSYTSENVKKNSNRRLNLSKSLQGNDSSIQEIFVQCQSP